MAITSKPDKKPIETYEHKDKQRLNNPPVGLVTLARPPYPSSPAPMSDLGIGGKEVLVLEPGTEGRD